MKAKNFLPFVMMTLFFASCSPTDLIKKLVDVDDLEEEEEEQKDEDKKDSKNKVAYRYTVTVHNGEHKGTHIYEEVNSPYYYAHYLYDKESKEYFITGAFTNKEHLLSMYMYITKPGSQKVVLTDPLSKRGEMITFVPLANQHLTLTAVSGEVLFESMTFKPSDVDKNEDHGFVSMKLTFAGTFLNFANKKEGEVEISGSVEVF